MGGQAHLWIAAVAVMLLGPAGAVADCKMWVGGCKTGQEFDGVIGKCYQSPNGFGVGLQSYSFGEDGTTLSLDTNTPTCSAKISFGGQGCGISIGNTEFSFECQTPPPPKVCQTDIYSNFHLKCFGLSDYVKGEAGTCYTIHKPNPLNMTSFQWVYSYKYDSFEFRFWPETDDCHGHYWWTLTDGDCYHDENTGSDYTSSCKDEASRLGLGLEESTQRRRLTAKRSERPSEKAWLEHGRGEEARKAADVAREGGALKAPQ